MLLINDTGDHWSTLLGCSALERERLVQVPLQKEKVHHMGVDDHPHVRHKHGVARVAQKEIARRHVRATLNDLAGQEAHRGSVLPSICDCVWTLNFQRSKTCTAHACCRIRREFMFMRQASNRGIALQASTQDL